VKRTHGRAGEAPHVQRAARGVDETLVPRWVPWLFAVLSLALAPGVARVFASAPPLHLAMHWRLAWGGFDVALAALLAATGLALFRRSALAEVLAAMTATLVRGSPARATAFTQRRASGNGQGSPSARASM
jgi:uncharacterized membrane protein